MDILELLKLFIGESATAALAFFAIWSLKKLYEERLVERAEVAAQRLSRQKEYAVQRLLEREDYANRLETINETFAVKLGEMTHALGANTQVLERLLAER